MKPRESGHPPFLGARTARSMPMALNHHPPSCAAARPGAALPPFRKPGARPAPSDHALSVQAAAGLGMRQPAAAFPEPARWPGTIHAISPQAPPHKQPQALYCWEHHSSLCVRSTPASPLPTRPSPNPPAFTIPNSHFSLLTSPFPLPTSAPVGRSASKALSSRTDQPTSHPASLNASPHASGGSARHPRRAPAP